MWAEVRTQEEENHVEAVKSLDFSIKTRSSQSFSQSFCVLVNLVASL